MFTQMTLDNGIRVVNQYVGFAKTVAMGVYVKAGSIYETVENNGVSHFVEHMVFKGTHKRSAHDIAEEMDNMGGLLNAYTSKECTCYHTNVLKEYCENAFEMIADIMLNATLNQTDIDLERNVIFEEIAMYEDSPEDLAIEILGENVYKNSSQSLTVLGTKESLNKINRNVMIDYMKKRYVPHNIVISFAGAISDNEAAHLANRYFGHLKHAIIDNNDNIFDAKFLPSIIRRKKDIEQVHLVVGFEGFPIADERRYSLSLYSAILGGGMSSILFQNIREKLGLAYSIYSYSASGSAVGNMNIYAGTNISSANQVLELIKKEIELTQNHSITSKQLEKVKNQYRCSYLMASEKVNSIMKSNGLSLIMSNKITTEKEFLDILERTTLDTISDVISEVMNPEKAALAVVGKDIDNIKF